MDNLTTKSKWDIFFFQAKDCIRDIGVTGVQTCALPIFRVFADALEGGGVVRGFRVPGEGVELPRRRLDELTEQARSLGAKGLVWAVVEEGGDWRDRKSVVEGKSVDFGGRRII